jgi:hypothetical protein
MWHTEGQVEILRIRASLPSSSETVPRLRLFAGRPSGRLKWRRQLIRQEWPITRSTRSTKPLREFIQIPVCCQSSTRFPTGARIVNNSRKIFGRKARDAADVVIVSWHWGLSPFQVYPGAGAGEINSRERTRTLLNDTAGRVGASSRVTRRAARSGTGSARRSLFR